jgi:hypothetical protein
MNLPQNYYEKESKTDLIPIKEVQLMLADILKQFVCNTHTLHRLTTDDTLFLLFRMTIFTPSQKVSDTLYIDWKIQVVAILKSMQANSEIYQYLHQHHYISLLIKMWEELLSNDELTMTDLQEVIVALDLLGHLFVESVNIGYLGLMDEMLQSLGYECFYKILITGPYNQDILQAKVSYLCTIRVSE